MKKICPVDTKKEMFITDTKEDGGDEDFKKNGRLFLSLHSHPVIRPESLLGIQHANIGINDLLK